MVKGAKRQTLLLSIKEDNKYYLYFAADSNGDYWAKINVDLKVKLNCFLVKPECLKLKDGQPIGEGNFGKIFLGELHNDGEDHGKQVAVKTLKG